MSTPRALDVAPAHALGPLAPLADYRQFIPVKLVPLANGKVDKLPIDHRTGSVTAKGSDGAHNPDIWLSYEHAAPIASALGPQHGVGFVLTAADPFTVVDIDNCSTPEGWSPLALEVCAALPGAVVEVSQSGRGLHVWLRSLSMPAHASKNTALGLECYSSRRFILLGSHANGVMADDCPGIHHVVARYFSPRQTTNADLGGEDEGPAADWHGPTDDEELLALAMRSRGAESVFGDGVTFKQLHDADADALGRKWPSAKGDAFDRSSADMAMASRCLFWTGGDVPRTESIMRGSGLMREKFDREGGYLVNTIRNARKSLRDYYRGGERAAAAPKQSAADVISTLREMNADEVLANWKALTVPLAADEREQVIAQVRCLTPLGPQALRRALRQADEATVNEHRQQALADRAANRVLIENRPEDCSAQAAGVEAAIVAAAAPGEYVSFGGVLSHVTTKAMPYTHLIDNPDEAPPAVPQIEPLDKVAMLQRVERVVVFYEVQAKEKRKAIGVPDRILEVLIGKKNHAAPIVSGLVTHPIVLRNGTILAADGLHAESRLFLLGSTLRDARPYSQSEAIDALHRLRLSFLDGFEFATQLDADVALAGLFTGVQRRLLDGAPGLAVLASTQSSGKTTVARRTHVVLTGRDMPASTFPLGDEAEVSKRLLSTLLRSPAMVCFDNIQDGFTFTSGALAAAMTSASYEQRVLGVSREADVPTSVLFVLTGNNLALGNDEVTRWMVTRLAPKTARPQERQFSNPDVVTHALRIRAAVLRDVVGIVAGFIVSGAALDLSGSRFPAWDRMVRQPLAWAGAMDVALVFRANTEESEDVRAHRALLWALRSIFVDREFKASEVSAQAQGPAHTASDTLRFALESINVKLTGAEIGRSISHRFKGLLGKVAHVDGYDVKLTKAPNSHDKVDRYRVVFAGLAGS